MLKLFFRILVHKPDDLTAVHSRTATDGKNNIRFKSTELSQTFACRLKRRIWCYIPEARVNNAKAVQRVFNSFGKATLVKELVGDKECTLFVEHVLELFKSFWHAALLEVHLIRSFEPKHVFAALSHRFNVKQVHHSYVSTYRVSTPRSATKC
ncbi:Uncharacterised protein [Chlamydia trachomatis]|nr:Uncharacterised protein [Chlamydia trachomatis]